MTPVVSALTDTTHQQTASAQFAVSRELSPQIPAIYPLASRPYRRGFRLRLLRVLHRNDQENRRGVRTRTSIGRPKIAIFEPPPRRWYRQFADVGDDVFGSRSVAPKIVSRHRRSDTGDSGNAPTPCAFAPSKSTGRCSMSVSAAHLTNGSSSSPSRLLFTRIRTR